jgi:Bacterial SH3 domain
MHRAAVVGSCIALLAKVALAAPGDALVVSGELVNMRAGPGMDYRVRLQVQRDQPAVELARDGEWVQLKLTDAAAEGWVHQSLLEAATGDHPADAPAARAAPASPETARSGGELALRSVQSPEPLALPSTDAALAEPASESEALARFRGSVDEFNARAQALAGVELFTGAEPAGSGTVQVRVTEAWDLVPEAGQESYANALFGHWQAVADGTAPLRLRLVDPSGKVVSEKSGP